MSHMQTKAGVILVAILSATLVFACGNRPPSWPGCCPDGVSVGIRSRCISLASAAVI